MNDKVQDTISAMEGTIKEILAEDVVPVLAGEMLKGTTLEFLNSAVGAISPRVGSVMIAYQQKRWERNWEKYIRTIYEKQEFFNERLNKLEEEQRNNFKNKLFPLVSDYVQNEKQEEKIQLVVNGLVNIASGVNAQDDIVLLYYDTLEQLSLLDIRILRIYKPRYYENEDQDNIFTIMREFNMENSQINMIKGKLVKLGLISSKNEEKMGENIENIIKYLEGISQRKKNIKLKKMNTINRSDSYKITSFGLKFIDFFTEVYAMKEEASK